MTFNVIGFRYPNDFENYILYGLSVSSHLLKGVFCTIVGIVVYDYSECMRICFPQ
jgi:hypothetical protein